MANELVISATELAKLKAVFGPPPVLSTENAKAYDEVWARLIRTFKPKDFMGHLLMRQLTDSTWEMMRYTRHKTLSIECKVGKLREFQAQQIKQAQRKEARARAATEKAGKPANELERVDKLEEVVDSSLEDVCTILNKPPEELEHADALEKSIEYHERLDALLNAAVFRRNDVLRQFELYEAGLARRLRQASDDAMYDFLERFEEDKHAELQVAQPSPPFIPPAE